MHSRQAPSKIRPPFFFSFSTNHPSRPLPNLFRNFFNVGPVFSIRFSRFVLHDSQRLYSLVSKHESLHFFSCAKHRYIMASAPLASDSKYSSASFRFRSASVKLSIAAFRAWFWRNSSDTFLLSAAIPNPSANTTAASSRAIIFHVISFIPSPSLIASARLSNGRTDFVRHHIRRPKLLSRTRNHYISLIARAIKGRGER